MKKSMKQLHLGHMMFILMLGVGMMNCSIRLCQGIFKENDTKFLT